MLVHDHPVGMQGHRHDIFLHRHRILEIPLAVQKLGKLPCRHGRRLHATKALRSHGPHSGWRVSLRSLLHRLGYRFTVHGPKNKSLPGRPSS
jgi:hypothetical protein